MDFLELYQLISIIIFFCFKEIPFWSIQVPKIFSEALLVFKKKHWTFVKSFTASKLQDFTSNFYGLCILIFTLC